MTENRVTVPKYQYFGALKLILGLGGKTAAFLIAKHLGVC